MAQSAAQCPSISCACAVAATFLRLGTLWQAAGALADTQLCIELIREYLTHVPSVSLGNIILEILCTISLTEYTFISDFSASTSLVGLPLYVYFYVLLVQRYHF